MLIDSLWESLDEARVKQIEERWSAESEGRINAVDRGELATVDGPAALKELRSSLRKSWFYSDHSRPGRTTLQ